MPSDSNQHERRQRTAGTHSGAARAAIKPHKRESGSTTASTQTTSAASTTKPQTQTQASTTPKPQAQAQAQAQAQTQQTLDVSAILTAWVNSLGANGLSQTYYGSAISKKEEQARKYFGFPASDKPFLILDATIFGTCKAGLALCSRGIYLRDTAGAQRAISWSDLTRCKLAADAQCLVIDSNKIVTLDGVAVGNLLATIKKNLVG